MARRRKKRRRGRKGSIPKSSAKRMINKALRMKGRGSVKGVWAMSRQAAKKGNIGLAVSLGNIAKSRSAFANRKKRSMF